VKATSDSLIDHEQTPPDSPNKRGVESAKVSPTRASLPTHLQSCHLSRRTFLHPSSLLLVDFTFSPKDISFWSHHGRLLDMAASDEVSTHQDLQNHVLKANISNTERSSQPLSSPPYSYGPAHFLFTTSYSCVRRSCGCRPRFPKYGEL
jgi:hypothetical protein